MVKKKKTRKKSDYQKLMSKFLKEEMAKITSKEKCTKVKSKTDVQKAFKKAQKRAKAENDLIKLRVKAGKKKTAKYQKF